MQATYQRLREQAYAQGCDEFDDLVARSTFRDFVVLYIAEGSKRDRNRIAIGNSDSRIVCMAAAHTLEPSDQLRDPGPRRSGPLEAPGRVGDAPQYRSQPDQPPAQVQQWEPEWEDLAVAARCSHGHSVGHSVARAPSVDGSCAGELVIRLRLFPRGVAQPGRALVLGTRGFAGSNPAAPIAQPARHREIAVPSGRVAAAAQSTVRRSPPRSR